MVDQRTMEKYEKEAKEQGRESWYLSWALDTNKEERAKVCLVMLAFVVLILWWGGDKPQRITSC